MSIKLRLTGADGSMPANPHDVAYAQPPVGAYPDGSLKVKGATVAPPVDGATLLEYDDLVQTGTGVAAQISATELLCRAAVIHAPSTNAATITVGPNASCRIPIFKGGFYNIPAIDGGVFDLSSWYFTATNPDQVHVLYVQ